MRLGGPKEPKIFSAISASPREKFPVLVAGHQTRRLAGREICLRGEVAVCTPPVTAISHAEYLSQVGRTGR